MAFVRCSRGGKTRALMELAKWLREQRTDLAIIYVTHADMTDLRYDEQRDLLAPFVVVLPLPH
jgi:hypothetical protein